MSKTIVIPSDKGNPVHVVLNGVRYTYTAGETVTVPDEVAALFEDNDGEKVIYGRHAVAPLTAPKRKGDNLGVPVMVDDQGHLYADAGGVEEIVEEVVDGMIYVEGHKLTIEG